MKKIIMGKITFGRKCKHLFWHFIIRQFTLWCVLMMKLAGFIGCRKRKLLPGEKCEIMLTGRFDSSNWILAHLGPLSASQECSKVWMVSTNQVPDMPKVKAIYPPKWLITTLGKTPARLLTFLFAAIWKRPHIVGGFHLIYNGIAAQIIGRLVGAKTLYFCIGGSEVDNQGIMDETNCFMNTKKADIIFKNRRLKIVSGFDLIITMGSRAAQFFRDNGIKTEINVVSGGIDSKRFFPGEEKPVKDIIFVARLSVEKRIDIFLEAIKLVKQNIPDVKVVLIGDGPLRENLEELAKEFKIDKNVEFLGYTDNVTKWLRISKIFVLTSDLEGLALSVIESMMCGLPAVVSNVGDLGDIVESGVNGYLVPRRRPDLFAEHLIELLSDERKLEMFSNAAHKSAMQYETDETVRRWDNIIASLNK